MSDIREVSKFVYIISDEFYYTPLNLIYLSQKTLLKSVMVFADGGIPFNE